MNHKKKLLVFFFIVFGIISLGTIRFFYNYISLKYFIKAGEKKIAINYAYDTIISIPNIAIGKDGKTDILKAVINDKNLLNDFKNKDFNLLDDKYQNNFYYQYIFGDLNKKKNWMNLDQLSYYFLSHKNANNWTKKIFSKNNVIFSDEFANSLLDFLKWQKNDDLFDFIINKYQIKNYEYIRPIKGISYKVSIKNMKDYVFNNLKIGRNNIGENYLKNCDFNGLPGNIKYWIPTDRKNSFYFKNESIEDNYIMRIYNINLNNDNRKRSFGEIKYRSIFNRNSSILKGYYIFSFDYWLQSGQEEPYFRGSKVKMHESYLKLQKTKTKVWIKIIYIFNNIKKNVEFFQPIIRMHGKGSMWIDNMFFSKILTTSIEFDEPYKIYYK